MPGEFQTEQAQVSAVEKKAGEMKEGKKTHEQLESELKAKHDVFFKQVDDTEKTFKEADKLKDAASKAEMGKDKQEIKDLLVKAAQSGETILKNNEQNPDFLTIRQSADRISSLTKNVAENLKFFQDMDLANDNLDLAKDNLKKVKAYEPEPGMAMREQAVGWQKNYKACMELGIGNVNFVTVMLAKYPAVATKELKDVYDRIKKENDDTASQLVESRMRFFENFGDKNNTYFDDEGKEHEMTQEQKDAVKKLQEIRNGKAGSNGETSGGYKIMMIMTSNGKFQLDQAKTAPDDKSKQKFLDDSKDCYTQAKEYAEGVSKDLAGLDSKLLPGTFAEIYNLMNNNTAASLKEASSQLEQLEKGAPVDSKAAIEAAEKEYSEGDASPKKSYENAVAARDKMMAGTELKLDDKDLQDATETALTSLCALRGKLAAFDRSTISREDQARFDILTSTIDSNIKELAQIKILTLNKSVIDSLDKDGKYLKIEKQEVNGMSVVVIKQTPEFAKLSPAQQQIIMTQFEAVQAQVSLDITRKMDLKEDKDWNDGMSQMETGNWQGAKKLLLDYYNKYKNNPEKALQIGAATGVLKKIVEMEFQQAKENLQMLDGLNKSNDDGGLKSVNHEELDISVTHAWAKMDSAQREVASGKYLTIEEVWKKVGPPANAKDVVEGTPLGGTDIGVTDVGQTVVDKVSFLNPKAISSLVSEPDPVKRRNNILKIARAAQAAGMTPFAKKYFEMYFAGEIAEKKKVITRDQVEQSFNADPEHEQQIKDGIQAAHDQARTKFITEDNRQHPFQAFDNANIERQNKILAKWEEDYKAGSGNIEEQVRNGIIDDLWTKEAKKAINADLANSKVVYASGGDFPELAGQLDRNAPVNIWHEAYGNPNNLVNTGVAENITGATLTFTADDIRNTCARIAVSILYLEIAAAAAAIAASGVGALALGGGIVASGTADAAALAALAESGMAVGSTQAFAAGAASFVVEGAVMHTVSVGLNEGAEGFKDPAKFFKGLATTYATLGVMKGVGSVLGSIGGKGAQAVAEGPGEFITPMSKGIGEAVVGAGKTALTLTGKSLVDSALMTGLSYGTERLFNGHTMTAAELKHAFGENFVTFMVMGGVHHVVETGGGTGEAKLSKEQKDFLKSQKDFYDRAANSEKLGQEARAKAEEARKSGSPDAAKYETDAARLEGEAVKLRRTAVNAEIDARVVEMKKQLERKDLPDAERKRLETLVAECEKIKADGGDLSKAEPALFEEHRVIEVPDPDNPGKMKKIDLFENYSSKNFAYSKEMAELMNNYEKLLKEGPKIIKHGGDEFVILHAGPDGKIQMFFGDVGNMGPTNEFALKVKGQDANMVDLYLMEFSQIAKSRFKPGQAVDGPALLNEIKNSLSKKYFGIESEADFNAMKSKWNLDGTWEDYQRNMGNARILAGFRGSSRALQKEFSDAYGDKSGDPAQINKDFADFISKKINGIDSGTPPLTEVLRQNLAAMEKSGALKDLFPEGSEFGGEGRMNKATLDGILSKSEASRSAEENMMLYFALQRVSPDKIGTLTGMDAGVTQSIRARFDAVRQPADMSTLMDFQMAGIDVPKFDGRPFNTSDMKFFLDKVLEDGLHEAKKQKGTLDIYQTDSPFDSKGEIRTDRPDSAKMQEAYDKAKQDKKADVIDQTQKLIREAQQKLDTITLEIRKLLDKPTLTEADTKALAELKKQYDEVVKKINADKFKDAETGADRPGKFAQDIDFWMRDREGNPIDKQFQMYREFVIDMHNTGAINGQKGYATTDAAMKKIADFMLAKFPGASSIIRTGGGSFKLVFLDSRQIPKVGDRPANIAEQQAMIQRVLPELNAEVQRLIDPDTNTVVDGSVRDATEAFRTRGGKPSPVGEVQLVSGAGIDATEFAARTGKLTSPKKLFDVFDPRKEPRVVPTEGSGTIPLGLDAKPKGENLPKVGDTVQLLSPLDGALDTFVVDSIDQTTGRVRLKDANGSIFRNFENMKALQAEILRTRIETDRANVPKEDLIKADIASGKLKFDLNNPEHVNALKQKMEAQDFAVLQANAPKLSPEVIASIVRGGVDLTQTSVNEAGETVTTTIRTYGGKELGQGAYGVVSEVAYVEKGSTELKYGVMKQPHATAEAQANFAHEGNAAGQIQGLESQFPEPGAAHLIKPVFVSDKAIVYEKAADREGKTSNLEKGVATMSEREWLQQFAGGVEGLAYMQAHGISHNDFKPGNVVVGPDGGILIDIGSKVSNHDLMTGGAQVLDGPNGPLTYYVTRDAAGNVKVDWVAQDPKYNNAFLLSDSIRTGKPLDVADKFAVGQSIRFFLNSKGYLDQTTGAIRPDAPAHAKELQQIADRLMVAQQHPFPFIDNNPARGVDPLYIPLDKVDGMLRDIASRPELGPPEIQAAPVEVPVEVPKPIDPKQKAADVQTVKEAGLQGKDKATVSMNDAFDAIRNKSPEAPTPLQEALVRLRDRDPQGFRILEANHSKFGQDQIDSIMSGSKVEFDANGTKLACYKLGKLGNGEYADVEKIMYFTNGGTEPHLGALRTLKSGEKFGPEPKGKSELLQATDNPILNRTLFHGDNFQILESGNDKLNFSEAHKVMDARQYLSMIRDVFAGYRDTFQKLGFAHIDLHNNNVISYVDAQGNRVTRIIDLDSTVKLSDVPADEAGAYRANDYKFLKDQFLDQFIEHYGDKVPMAQVERLIGVMDNMPRHVADFDRVQTAPKAVDDAIMIMDQIIAGLTTAEAA